MTTSPRKMIGIIAVVLLAGGGIFAYEKGWIPWLRVTSPEIPAQSLNVPDGFTLDIIAKDLNKPRVVVFDPKGRPLVSEMGAGNVVAIESSADNVFQKRVVIGGLQSPHGLAFYTDSKTKKTYLYVAETNRVVRYGYNVGQGTVLPGDPGLIASLPADGEHFTRTIGFGPNFRKTPIIQGYLEKETQTEQKLYISVGSSCNVCIESSWKRAAILESDPEGSYTAEFAGGLRNSVFFTFHPVTGQLWATEMGRDNLGDDMPPDEINIVRVAEAGNPFGARRYGWPFCYGKQVRDTTFNPEKVERTDIPSDCAKTEPPRIEIPAHSAPLGLAFITPDRWPKEWRNDLLVAYHGSWNRSVPTGYKIVKYDLDEKGNVLGVEDFMTGFLKDGRVSGRPVDLKFDSHGDLYITDDYAGVIYRITPALFASFLER